MAMAACTFSRDVDIYYRTPRRLAYAWLGLSDLPLKNLGGDSEVVVKIKPIPNVQEAIIYTDIIKPIFQSKCYGCHGPTKQKGKLRLDQPE